MLSLFGTACERWNIHTMLGINRCMTLPNFPQKFGVKQRWEHCFRKSAFGWKKKSPQKTKAVSGHNWQITNRIFFITLSLLRNKILSKPNLLVVSLPLSLCSGFVTIWPYYCFLSFYSLQELFSLARRASDFNASLCKKSWDEADPQLL